MDFNIYQDIATRTNGDIYIGVVGPVRTGKSTFIKNFMERLIIPNIEHEFQAQRTRDELPQSGSGRSIMTTEPKFVPNEAIKINVDDKSNMKVRLVDCVGYIVDDAIGYEEEGIPRMVMTPWYDTPVPFTKAAELGTQKVINDHSTIGVIMTTDGSIVDLPRSKYIEAEERVVNELKSINKPFVILLNTRNPGSDEVENLRHELMEKYDSAVITVDVLKMGLESINSILREVLYEFPIKEIRFNIPVWLKGLNDNNPIKKSLMEIISNKIKSTKKIRDIIYQQDEYSEMEFSIASIDLGKGIVEFNVDLDQNLFYNALNDISNKEIINRLDLYNYILDLTDVSNKYSKIKPALDDVKNMGYGIVQPNIEELLLDDPEVIKQGNKYAMKLKANAPSIHLMSATVDTEVTPYIGTEKECERILDELVDQFENNPEKMWQTEIFGKKLDELVMNNLHTKISKMPPDTQEKIKSTLSKVLNENGGGIVFIFI